MESDKMEAPSLEELKTHISPLMNSTSLSAQHFLQQPIDSFDVLNPAIAFTYFT